MISLLLLVVGKDSCSGDSGGPLMVSEFPDVPFAPRYQIGVVSFGTTYCGVGLPGIYTRITNYLPWIASKLQP